jgi:hypothetical protein
MNQRRHSDRPRNYEAFARRGARVMSVRAREFFLLEDSLKEGRPSLQDGIVERPSSVTPAAPLNGETLLDDPARKGPSARLKVLTRPSGVS